jgi:hypothetical protein
MHVDIKHTTEEAVAEEKAIRAFYFGLRQALLAMNDHLERYMRHRKWLNGALTSEYRKKGRAEDRRIGT